MDQSVLPSGGRLLRRLVRRPSPTSVRPRHPGPAADRQPPEALHARAGALVLLPVPEQLDSDDAARQLQRHINFRLEAEDDDWPDLVKAP
ncbi:hypothetical protein [Aeromicrobium sp. UC242_57]|uniref:hypothetical protein n=1 Tax=Aeromicrobium sp. UC242_57 TaxID=3374624 RepID=UPI003789E2BB